MKKAILKLADGSEYEGFSFGCERSVAGELVFYTAMTGYPESLSDPSYRGQILIPTYPMIGNYGVPGDETVNGVSRFFESDRIQCSALVISDYSERYSHWDSRRSLGQWLKEWQVPGICGIDTRALTKKLREQGLELRKMVTDGKSLNAIKQRKTEMLGVIYNMLSLALGEPIKSFDYAFKNKDGKAVTPVRTYTPLEFYKETQGGPINGTFIMAMNDPRREYYKTYEVEWDRHTYDGHNWRYINLPMEDIAQMAIASLQDSTKLYSSYDVGKQLNRSNGYLSLNNYDYGTLFGTTFGMNKAERIATFDSGSTHAMTLTAVDLDANGKPIKWKVENSWGADSGHKGYIIMTNEWFNEFAFRLVVDNKYVPERILKSSQQKPVMVMPEDPLFQEDN